MEQFRESQRMLLQRTTIVILVAVTLIASGTSLIEYYNGTEQITPNGQWFSLLLFPLVFVFFYLIRLDTEVNAIGVSYRFFPFHFRPRLVRWEEMSKAEVRRYAPIREYGGWGIKGFFKNKSVTVGGKMGLQLYLSNGKKLLIGTQKPEELRLVIDKLSEKGQLKFSRNQ